MRKAIIIFILFFCLVVISGFSSKETESVLSIENSKNIVLLEKLEGHEGKLWCVTFSAGGLLVTSGKDGKAIVWKPCDETGSFFEKVFEAEMRKLVKAVDFIGEDTLITLSDDNLIRYWDLETGELINEERGEYGHIGHILVSEDDRLLAVESKGRIDVSDLESGEKLYHIWEPEGTCFEYRFTSDNKKMITSSHEGSVALWNLESGEKMREFMGHQWDVHAIDIGQDGRYIVTGSTDYKVKLWDLETGKCIHTMSHYDGLYDVAFSPDGTLIASVGCDSIIMLWDTETGRRLKLLQHDDEIHAVDFSPDGRYIIAGGYDSDIYIWGLD